MADATSARKAPTDEMARNLWAGGRLAAAAMAFVFISFVFAFYYLRELNIENKWRPSGVDPPLAFGLAILACMLASVAVFWVATRQLAAGRAAVWRASASVALLLGFIAMLLVWLEIPDAGFRPTDGAYASVFFGWTGFFGAALLSGVYYLETIVAKAVRHRSGGLDPVLVAGEVDAFGVYWYFMALVTVLTFVLLYLVA